MTPPTPGMANELAVVDVRVSPLFAPAGWLVGGVWVVLFALLGWARWRLVGVGTPAGRQGARWTVAFVVVCALYPAYTRGLQSLVAGLVGNLATALFAVALGLRVRRIDGVTAGVFALVVGWLCYATLAIMAQLGYPPASLIDVLRRISDRVPRPAMPFAIGP